jgi:hypothetical protein
MNNLYTLDIAYLNYLAEYNQMTIDQLLTVSVRSTHLKNIIDRKILLSVRNTRLGVNNVLLADFKIANIPENNEYYKEALYTVALTYLIPFNHINKTNEDIILDTVKFNDNIEESINIFGFRKIKLKLKEYYSINKLNYNDCKIQFKYQSKKLNNEVDTIIIPFEGKNYRFLLSDVTITGKKQSKYNPPKIREFKNFTEVILKNNKNISIPKNSKVLICELEKTDIQSKRIKNSNLRQLDIVKFIYNNKKYSTYAKNLKVI